jgi:hypothetical protein
VQLVFLLGEQNRYVTIQSTQEIARYNIHVIIFTRKRLKARQIVQSDGFTSFVCALAQAPAGDEYMKMLAVKLVTAGSLTRANRNRPPFRISRNSCDDVLPSVLAL